MFMIIGGIFQSITCATNRHCLWHCMRSVVTRHNVPGKAIVSWGHCILRDHCIVHRLIFKKKCRGSCAYLIYTGFNWSDILGSSAIIPPNAISCTALQSTFPNMSLRSLIRLHLLCSKSYLRTKQVTDQWHRTCSLQCILWDAASHSSPLPSACDSPG